MATELAVGYITLIPSARGITSGIQRELGAPLESAAKDSGKKTSSAFSNSFASGASKLKNLLLGAIGAASVVQAVRSVATATDNLETGQAQLANALRATHQAANAFGADLGPLLKQNVQWGNTNADVYDSLSALVRAGASAKTAVKDEALAANLAAARHISLASATQIVSKVLTGHVALLGRYGIATKDSTGKTISQAAALQLLGQRFGGAASANAVTFSGKVKALHAQLSNFEATIGQKVIPILLQLGSGIASVVGWFEKGSAPARALAIAIAAGAAGFVAYKVALLAQTAATTAATLAQQLFTTAAEETDAALVANPIGLAVAAFVALGVAVFEAYKHFGPFHAAVDAAWQILQAVFHWIVGHWPLLLVILTGPIGLAVDIIAKHWRGIVSGAQTVIAFITSHWRGLLQILTGPFGLAVTWIVSHWSAVTRFFGGLGKAIAHGLSNLYHALVSPFETAFNAIKRIWDDTIGKLHLPSGIGSVLGKVAGFAGIHLASGGIVTQPTIALVGEAGPEAVVPLSRAPQLLADASDLQGGSGLRPVIHAETIVQGNVYGDAHLQELFRQHDRDLQHALAAGSAA